MATPTAPLISSASQNILLPLRGRPHDASVTELDGIRSFIEPLWREKSNNVNMVRDAILHKYSLRVTPNQLHKRFQFWKIKKNKTRQRRPGPAPSLVLGPHLTIPQSVRSSASQIADYQSWAGKFLSSMQGNLSRADCGQLFQLIRLPLPDDLSSFCRLPPSMGPPGLSRTIPYVSLSSVEMPNRHKCSINIELDILFQKSRSKKAAREAVLDCEKRLGVLESINPSAKNSFAYEALKIRLGLLYFQSGNLKAALAYFEHVDVSKDRPWLLTALFSYFFISVKMRETEKMIESWKPFHAAFLKDLIHFESMCVDPSTAVFLGFMFEILDDYDGAEELYLRSAQQCITSYGLKSIRTYQVVTALASLKIIQKHDNESRRHYELALKLGCTVPYLDAKEKIQDMLSFAQVLKSQRSFEYSREVLEATLELAQKTLDLKDPLIFKIQYKLANALQRFKEVEKSEILFRQNISASINIDGNSDSEIANTHQLSILLVEQGRVEEALEWPFKMLKYFEDSCGILLLTESITLEILLTHTEGPAVFKALCDLAFERALDLTSQGDHTYSQHSESASDAQPVILQRYVALLVRYIIWDMQYSSQRSSHLTWVQEIARRIAHQEDGIESNSQKEQYCAKFCKDQENDLKDYLNLEDTD